MENKSAGGPVVRISHDQMEAYLLLPMVNFDQTYKFEEVMDLLDKNGVRFGVDKKVIDNMISNRIFGREVLVAHGEPWRMAMMAIIILGLTVIQIKNRLYVMMEALIIGVCMR